jgi:hypothetical protein
VLPHGTLGGRLDIEHDGRKREGNNIVDSGVTPVGEDWQVDGKSGLPPITSDPAMSQATSGTGSGRKLALPASIMYTILPACMRRETRRGLI